MTAASRLSVSSFSVALFSGCGSRFMIRSHCSTNLGRATQNRMTGNPSNKKAELSPVLCAPNKEGGAEGGTEGIATGIATGMSVRLIGVDGLGVRVMNRVGVCVGATHSAGLPVGGLATKGLAVEGRAVEMYAGLRVSSNALLFSSIVYTRQVK